MKYFEYLGQLVADMQALKFLIRAFLVKDEIAKGLAPSSIINFNSLKAGDKLLINAFCKLSSKDTSQGRNRL